MFESAEEKPVDFLPRHVAIIMDGNGRWAKERGLPRTEGHRVGAESVQEVIEGAVELGIEYMTLYAFSSENWKRPEREINALMKLLIRFLKDKEKELLDQNIKLQAIGRLHRLSEKCLKQLHRTIEATSHCTGTTLILALSYGAREEIVDGIKSIVHHVQEGHIDPAMIDEDIVSKHLYTRYYPDPDILVRTSGEMRISNFLLWQISYSELIVVDKNWPDFRKEDLLLAVKEFGRRNRRYGGI